jgi:hypothetical protein
MIFSCSRIALFVLFTLDFVFSLLFYLVESAITPIERRSTETSPNKVELRIRDISQNPSDSKLNHPIVQTLGGVLIGVVGLCLGGCLSLYCLRKRGYIHSPASAIKSKNFRSIPKGGSERSTFEQKRESLDSPSTYEKHEPIMIIQHGPAADIPESSENIQDSLSLPSVYGSQHASNSMVNLSSPPQHSNLPVAAGGETMIRSRSG